MPPASKIASNMGVLLANVLALNLTQPALNRCAVMKFNGERACRLRAVNTCPWPHKKSRWKGGLLHKDGI